MAMNLTKLSNAEYPLRDAREAIDGDNALNPSDPSAYYTAAGNPPGVWIGKGAELVGGKVGTTASSKTVRALINERRNPSNGQYLGDIKMSEGDNGEAPVAGFDLTTRQPKSISILWAFGDKETRDGIDECMRKAVEMTIDYFENEYATTRAGQGGVAQRRGRRRGRFRVRPLRQPQRRPAAAQAHRHQQPRAPLIRQDMDRVGRSEDLRQHGRDQRSA